MTGLFGASALYHRVSWRPEVRRWMRRLDHSMIFVLIAGTYTPFALLAFDDGVGRALLIAVWCGAAGGVALKLLWIDAPNWLGVMVYVALGWLAVWTFPALAEALGVVPTVLVALGGLLYTTGAVIYATRRPDPVPAVFGYHEVFHLLVVIAAALQYAVVVFWVLLLGASTSGGTGCGAGRAAPRSRRRRGCRAPRGPRPPVRRVCGPARRASGTTSARARAAWRRGA